MSQLLSQEEFAEHAAEALIEPSVSGTLVLDRQQFALVIKDDKGRALQTTYLQRFFQAYKADPARLQNILTDIANFSRQRDDISNYEQIKPYLMPAIRDRAQHYLDWQKQVREFGDAAGSYIAYVKCENFAIFPVIDTGHRQIRISSQTLAVWSKSFEEVLVAAAENLIEATTHHNFAGLVLTEIDRTCSHESIWNDHYDAVRMFYFDWNLRVNGTAIHLLSDPSHILVWGAEDQIGTAVALTKLEEMSKYESSNKMLPPYPLFRSADGEIEVYKPDPKAEAALYSALTRSQLIHKSMTYATQKEFLDGDADYLVQDVFISSFVALQSKDGHSKSTCTWTKGIVCLLPETEYLGFSVVDEAAKDSKYLGEVPWKLAVSVLGEQMVEEPWLFPRRYKTVGFPSAAQFQKMGISV